MCTRASRSGKHLVERRVSFDGNSHPYRAWRERVDERRRAANMVGITMREDERAQTANAARPQRRREHAGANIETGRPEPEATRVEHDVRPGRQLEQQRVALAHIERGETERRS